MSQLLVKNKTMRKQETPSTFTTQNIYFSDDIVQGINSFYKENKSNALMAICLNGTANLLIDFESFTFSSNDLLLITSFQTSELLNKTDNFRAIIMTVNEAFINQAIINSQKKIAALMYAQHNPVTVLTVREKNSVIQTCQFIKDKLEFHNETFYTETIQSYIIGLFYEVVGIVSPKQIQNSKKASYRKEQLFNQFLELLVKHYKKEHRVSFYASQLCISPKYLSTLCTAISRKTPRDWIDDNLIIEAKVLLSQTNRTISSISDELNFYSQSYFTKFFLRKMQQLPSEFRNKQL